jgi:hypothetical protein
VARLRELRSDGLDVASFAQLVTKLDWSALPVRAPARWVSAIRELSSSNPDTG